MKQSKKLSNIDKKKSEKLLPCNECSIMNLMQPCEACENNPKKRY